MLKVRHLILVGILTYLIVLLAQLPAVWVVPWVNRQLVTQSVELVSVGGSVWQGQAEIATLNADDASAPWQGTRVNWNVLILSGLWRGQLHVDMQVFGRAAQLKGQVRLGWKQFGVQDVSGEISPMLLNTLLASYARTTQPVQLSHVSVKVLRTGQGQASGSGRLLWPAGDLVLKQNAGSTLAMPAVTAELTTDNKALLLTANANNAQLVTLRMQANGEATVTALRRILSLLGQADGEVNADAVLMELPLSIF